MAVACGAGYFVYPYIVATAFMLDVSGSSPSVRRLLPVRSYGVATRDVDVPTRYGAVRSRVYIASTHATRAVLVVPGMHGGGVDEPRLAAFSRRLASTGLNVVSVPVPDLRRYRISPTSTDEIEDAAVWLASQRDLAPQGRIVLAGISYGGGLSLVAAGRPRLAGKLERVISFGGHADLPRVMDFLCTGRLPDGTSRAPHDYAVDIFVMAAIPKLVPADQVGAAQAALTMFLDASGLESAEPAKAGTMFAASLRAAEALPEPSRTVLMHANDRTPIALGGQLRPYIEELGGAAALSPDRSPATRAPVFVLHGEQDNVIPSTETPLLRDFLLASGNRDVHTLLTPLLSHADIQTPTLGHAWTMVAFWKNALAQ